MPATSRRPVCMIVHAYYEEDPRVRRAAEALVARGRPVDVYALRRPGDEPYGTVGGVRVHRLDVQRHQGAGIATYLLEYLVFLVRAGWAITRVHRRRRFAVVHVHTPPDFLIAAGLPVRLLGIPLVIDLHEAMPEFFRIRFPRASNRLIHRLLMLQERVSIALASAAITVNDALAARLVGLGVPASKVTVVMNSPSLELFDAAAQQHREFREDGSLRLVYAGALSPVYELDVALHAVARIADLRPDLDVRLDLYGRDYGEVSLVEEATQLGIADRVTFHGRIPLGEVPAALAAADIGLAPTRRNPFTDFSLSTKIFEYGAMGKPVVASRLPMVERTFPPGSVATYEPGNAGSLASAILGLCDDPNGRQEAVGRTAARIHELSWEREADRLSALIERLAPDGISSSPAQGSDPTNPAAPPSRHHPPASDPARPNSEEA